MHRGRRSWASSFSSPSTQQPSNPGSSRLRSSSFDTLEWSAFPAAAAYSSPFDDILSPAAAAEAQGSVCAQYTGAQSGSLTKDAAAGTASAGTMPCQEDSAGLLCESSLTGLLVGSNRPTAEDLVDGSEPCTAAGPGYMGEAPQTHQAGLQQAGASTGCTTAWLWQPYGGSVAAGVHVTDAQPLSCAADVQLQEVVTVLQALPCSSRLEPAPATGMQQAGDAGAEAAEVGGQHYAQSPGSPDQQECKVLPAVLGSPVSLASSSPRAGPSPSHSSQPERTQVAAAVVQQAAVLEHVDAVPSFLAAPAHLQRSSEALFAVYATPNGSGMQQTSASAEVVADPTAQQGVVAVVDQTHAALQPGARQGLSMTLGAPRYLALFGTPPAKLDRPATADQPLAETTEGCLPVVSEAGLQEDTSLAVYPDGAAPVEAEAETPDVTEHVGGTSHQQTHSSQRSASEAEPVETVVANNLIAGEQSQSFPTLPVSFPALSPEVQQPVVAVAAEPPLEAAITGVQGSSALEACDGTELFKIHKVCAADAADEPITPLVIHRQSLGVSPGPAADLVPAEPVGSPLLQLSRQVDQITCELAAIDTCLSRAAGLGGHTAPPVERTAGRYLDRYSTPQPHGPRPSTPLPAAEVETDQAAAPVPLTPVHHVEGVAAMRDSAAHLTPASGLVQRQSWDAGAAGAASSVFAGSGSARQRQQRRQLTSSISVERDGSWLSPHGTAFARLPAVSASWSAPQAPSPAASASSLPSTISAGRSKQSVRPAAGYAALLQGTMICC